MDREDFVLLLRPEGQALLNEVAYDCKADLLKLVSGLRDQGHSPMLVAAVLRNYVSALGRPIFATAITGLGIFVNAINWSKELGS